MGTRFCAHVQINRQNRLNVASVNARNIDVHVRQIRSHSKAKIAILAMKLVREARERDNVNSRESFDTMGRLSWIKATCSSDVFRAPRVRSLRRSLAKIRKAVT